MPDVLFLCAGNSCRSQMTEGWLRHLAGDSGFQCRAQASVVFKKEGAR